MSQITTATANKPAWVELSTPDTAASGDFYSRLFGWSVEVSPDAQYGGYAMARIGDADVAGIGPKQSDQAPTAWGIYIGTDEVDALGNKVQQAGGTVLAAPFDVGDQGRMAVFQDPTGAVISAWQAAKMRNFKSNEPNTLGWIELNARGLEKAIPFYESVFGWTHRKTPFGEGQEYTEFLVDGDSVAGAMEMNPMVPANVPSYWAAYFGTDDVDATYRKAIELGGREMLAPQDYPGGRFAILSDPQGATFALFKSAGQ
ncbi:MAG: VOC family protein [Chloroflexota bacterium]|nr:VOC family protein [Chloroflexota bacterium]